MNYLLTSIVAASLSLTAWTANAEPVDDGPPAQIQKEAVPNSTEDGNYLEAQPDNNGATKSGDKKDKAATPNKLEKSKKVLEDPIEGGVDLK